MAVVTSGTTCAGNIVLPNAPVSASALSETLQRRLAHVSEKFGGGSNAVSTSQNDDDDDEDDDDSDSREGDEVSQHF
jgi:hypothetical protein